MGQTLPPVLYPLDIVERGQNVYDPNIVKLLPRSVVLVGGEEATLV
jgi:hypothetical protein